MISDSLHQIIEEPHTIRKETDVAQSKELIEELGKKTLFTQTHLKCERGWSDRAIQQLLGPCDKDKPNPFNSSGSRMKLYLRSRVLAAEATPEFAALSQAKERRRVAQTEAAKRKQTERLHFLTDLRFDIPRIANYRQLACEAYNALWADRGCYEKKAHIEDDKPFLDRITVNFLRHECSDYHRIIAEADDRWELNQQELHTLRNEVLRAIASTYPELRAECMAQCGRDYSFGKAA